MTFAYEKPRSVDALSQLLAQAGGDAALLAGGTDLLLQLRAGNLRAKLVVDVKGVEELTTLQHDRDGAAVIGAAVTMNRIADDKRFRPIASALADGAGSVGTFAIRNRATLGGNLGNASPCADTRPLALPVGCEPRAAVGVRGQGWYWCGNSSRECARPPGAPRSSSRACGFLPRDKARGPSSASSRRLRGHDLALVNAALCCDPDRKRLRVAVGSCSPAPIVVDLDDLFRLARCDRRRASGHGCHLSHQRRASRSLSTEPDMTGLLVRQLFQDLQA